MQPCESAGMCGIVDRHPDEKKQLSELGKKKQKLDGEIKAITSDLKIKEKISKDHNQSFESKIHDILIKTNPQKYLTVNRRPKEGIILADTYVIKKYYGGKNPTKDALENDSDIFQTIIESHESKIGTTTPKNSVMKQLEDQGIQWPRQAAASSVSAFGFPQNYMNWQMAPVLPPGYVGPIASPPPPYPMEPYQPPLPQTADDGTERPPLPAEEMP